MEVNKDNFEAYILDYWEGRLKPGQVADLLLFLEQNPGLRDQFDGFEMITLSPDTQIKYADKNSLKKQEKEFAPTITAENYEEYFVASLEGELNGPLSAELSGFLGAHPELAAEYGLFRKTFLVPDMSLVFDRKSSLKRIGVVPARRRFIYYASAVAASVLLLIGLYFILPGPPATETEFSSKHALVPRKEIKQNPTDVQYAALNGNSRVRGKKSAVSPVTGSARPEQPENISSETTEINIAAAGSARPVPSLTAANLAVNVSESEPATVQMNERYYFTEIYTFIRYREQMQYEEWREKQNDRSRMGKTVLAVRELFGHQEVFEPHREASSFNLWALADIGITGFNTLTNSNVRLQTETDDDGKVVAYGLFSDRFELTRSVRQK